MAFNAKQNVKDNIALGDKYLSWNPLWNNVQKPLTQWIWGIDDAVPKSGNATAGASVPNQPTYSSLYDTLNSQYNNSGAGGIGASADSLVAEAAKPVDLSGVKKAYADLDEVYRSIAASGETSARNLYDLTKTNLESARNITRSDLLKSIERFREENNRNREAQRRDYLLGQSELEDARMEANRQSRISAASRGLSGSGLQQLAQLQNLLGQSQDISKLITTNQDEMDNLKRALSQKEEDYNTGLSRAEEAYNLGIRGAENTLADTLANISNTLSGNLASSAKDIANLELNAAYNTKDAVLQAKQYALGLKNSLLGSQGNAKQESDLLKSNIDQIVNEASRLAEKAGDSTGKKVGSKKYNEAYNRVIGEQIGSLNSLLSEYSIYNTQEGQTGLNSLYALYK